MLRLLFVSSVLLVLPSLFAQTASVSGSANPLESYSPEWKKPTYQACHTAAPATYMSASEQEVIFILNMMRSNPGLFLRSVLLNPRSAYYIKPGEKNTYKTSLLAEMRKLKSSDVMLQPDALLFESARCHAETSGKTGYVGHDRMVGCRGSFMGECISYGSDNPMAVVMQLLIDEDVPSLGHRRILFNFTYSEAGVATRTHSGYGSNTVIGFR